MTTEQPARSVPRRAAVGESLAVLALAAAVWVAAARLPGALLEGQAAPGAWPSALAASLGGLGLVLLGLAVTGRMTAPPDIEPVNRARWPVLVGVVAILAGLLAGWAAVGYLPAAVVAFPLLSRLAGVGGWVRSVLWGAGLALLTWALFGQLLGIAL